MTNAGVIEIPGYRNFSDFTSDYADLVQSVLNRSQIGDGGFGLGFIRGLSGEFQVQPEVLSKMMDDTYKLVKGKKRIAYQKLQIEGIQSHAWLVVDMEKTANGYTMDVIDSNYGSMRKVTYTKGMTQMYEYNSVPYTSRNSFDQQAFDVGIKKYCWGGRQAGRL
jgi:hypothetical protein